jgi:glucose/arabinose dehydrogenase
MWFTSQVLARTVEGGPPGEVIVMRRAVGALAVLSAMALATTGLLHLEIADAGVIPPAAQDTSEVRAPALPTGFSDTTVHVFPEGENPTALAFLPDGRMLVTTQEGRLWIFPTRAQGFGEPTVVLDLSTHLCSNTERGLVGVAVDPLFDTNQYVYLYWTHNVHDTCTAPGLALAPENRVTRSQLSAEGTEVAGSRKVIVDHIVSPREHHIAGDLQFGADGFLYISVGDGVCRISEPQVCGNLDNNSQLPWLPQGKILRVTSGGRPAPGNPYAGADRARRCTRPRAVPPGKGPCAEIFASGLRNPFRIAQRPGTSTFFINDVGQHTWEEIDRLVKGANYGWNLREGHCEADSATRCGPSRFVEPVHDYRHSDCRAISGGAFVPTGVWPARLDGAYLFSDYTCGTIFRLVKNGGSVRQRPFLTGLKQPIHLRFGPSPFGSSLYYLSFFKRQVHRVSYHPGNLPPIAAFAFVPDGQSVAFDGHATYDPDRSGLASWHWDFGDGSIVTTPTGLADHTYGRPGSYDVTLTVTDSRGATSDPFTTSVEVPNHLPSVQVDWPPDGTTYAVGQEVTLAASATDLEDGALPGTAISWDFRLRHGNHFHPLALAHGNTVSVTYPAPEDLIAAAHSSVRVIVTVTDSSGLAVESSRTLVPTRVHVTIGTRPRGGVIRVEGDLRRTPFAADPWQGQVFNVLAPDQRIAGRRYLFRSWNDGGKREHNITTPRRSTTYTARFRLAG